MTSFCHFRNFIVSYIFQTVAVVPHFLVVQQNTRLFLERSSRFFMVPCMSHVSRINLLKTELLQTIGCLSSTRRVLMFLLARVDQLKGKTVFKMTQMFQKWDSEMMF